MPSELVVYRVCDICVRDRRASTHKIVHNGRLIQIDLCADHAQPLEDLLERYALASDKAPGYSTSPHRCDICSKVLSRRVHAHDHVRRRHGYPDEECDAHIRPVGLRVVQSDATPALRPHRCLVCKKPYVNSSTAKRHVQEVHPERLGKRKTPKDLVVLIEEEEK